MQEHFSAGAWIVRQPENEGHFRWADMPEMQEHFPAGAWIARQLENEGHFR